MVKLANLELLDTMFLMRTNPNCSNYAISYGRPVHLAYSNAFAMTSNFGDAPQSSQCGAEIVKFHFELASKVIKAIATVPVKPLAHTKSLSFSPIAAIAVLPRVFFSVDFLLDGTNGTTRYVSLMYIIEWPSFTVLVDPNDCVISASSSAGNRVQFSSAAMTLDDRLVLAGNNFARKETCIFNFTLP